MLRLHQSDKLEYLADLLIGELSPPPPPFQAETIIVQSHGMGRWVSLRLAERLGICAQVQFPLPASFVWDLLRRLFPDLPKRSPFSAEVLAFRIMDWLGRPENLERAPRLAAYLKDGDELRRFQLATRVADVFDQYLVYREDWISAWERGESVGLGGDEEWQSLLWRDLITGQTVPHRARMMSDLLAILGDSPHPSPLPGGEGVKRLSVFGVSSLPPVFLEVLRRLSERIEINIYALNPCRQFWGEIRDDREIGRLAGEREPEDLYLEVGHPLLASLGKQGREFFDSLADCAEGRSLFDEEPPRDSLLHSIQADILELVDRKKGERLPIAPNDRSLQIHVCHSPMREVEVLRDQLLALFDADTSLKPGDVAVLTPNIERYTPYIEAVFAPSPDAPSIPYGIADRSSSQQHTLLETFLALLDLPESRFHADATLSFLDQPAVLRRFDLSEDDLGLIRDWARAVGARWGRDGGQKAEHGLPPMPRHTWREAMERMMLGYALPQAVAGEELPLFDGILPYDDIEGGRALILGNFVEFLETLFDWADRLKDKRPLPDWADILNAVADAFFDARDEDETVLLQLRGALDALREFAEQAGFREAVELRVAKSWLAGRLDKAEGASGFLTGSVTFCAMVPMRSLPFRVIAVLGLDYDAFPRQHHAPGFDLMARHPRRGDRSRRLDDRYLFLETLLSARDLLYLSYVGRNIRDNSVMPPSPLVSELVDVVGQSVEFPSSFLKASGFAMVASPTGDGLPLPGLEIRSPSGRGLGEGLGEGWGEGIPNGISSTPSGLDTAEATAEKDPLFDPLTLPSPGGRGKQNRGVGADEGKTKALEQHLITEHPLQPFDPAYFRGDPRRPGYSAAWLAAARRIGRGENGASPLFEAELPEPDEEWRSLDPESLAYFFSNPARYLLRRRLNLVLEDADLGFDIREPFRLDFRSRDLIRCNLLDTLRRRREPRAALQWAEAQGLLPHGRFGTALHGQEQSLVQRFAPNVMDDLDAARLPPLPVEFEAHGLRLSGFLNGASQRGLAEFGFEAPRAHAVIHLWLRHLMLCLAAPAGVEKCSVLRTPKKTLRFPEVPEAGAELAKLLAAYWTGLSQPLPFFPRTSYCYADQRLFPPNKLADAPEPQRRNAALDKARGEWQGNDFHAGECQSAYYAAVYRGTDPLDEAFENLALDLLGPMLEWMRRGESV